MKEFILSPQAEQLLVKHGFMPKRLYKFNIFLSDDDAERALEILRSSASDGDYLVLDSVL